MKSFRLCLFLIAGFYSANIYAQGKTNIASLKSQAFNDLNAEKEHYKKIALQIWDYAELGYKEIQSSALLQEELKAQGFNVQPGVAGIPTAFVASYGQGSPVIGILAEYDALPGLSQQAIPEKQPVDGKTSGHACGHHLFGTASVAAAIELKKLMIKNGIKGTIKVFGCPAEEGGSGKVYMVRDGLFKGVDIALHWHPGSENRADSDGALANKSAKFRFYGVSAHASASPEKGRSALDAVEAMNYMTNMMREHIPSSARMHYVITNGGKAPNIVPDFAEVYYYVRHPDKEEVVRLFDRIEKAAEGAAIGTGTTMKYEIIGGTHDLLLNKTLTAEVNNNLQKVGGIEYTAEEKIFAEKIRESFGYPSPTVEEALVVKSVTAEQNSSPGSTDVGDVSYNVPTAGFNTATWIPGTSAHSWQAVACGGTDIGIKGMMVAAKTLAATGIDLFTNPELIIKAKKEFAEAKGSYQYKALLGDRAPALNYRD